MAFDFPSSPAVGQQFTPVAGVTYTWNGYGWDGGSGILIISDTAPASPTNGSLWWESDTGILWIYFTDANSSQWVMAAGGASAVVAAPQCTVLTSGSGTYITPTGATWLEVEMVGGGGPGGGGTGTPTGGGNTTFGALTCNGGGAGNVAATTPNVNGGTASGGDINLKGADGSAAAPATLSGSLHGVGADGGVSPFGGAGRGCNVGGGVGGGNASANTGSGGGGGGIQASSSGNNCQGGGAGGYLRKLITSPAATYSYAVGTGGAPGTNSGANIAGGAGGSGIIIVTAHFGG